MKYLSKYNEFKKKTERIFCNSIYLPNSFKKKFFFKEKQEIIEREYKMFT